MRRILTLLPALLLACGDKDSDDTGEDVDDTGPVDADADGYDAEEDCDDSDPTVNPGADEVCDGIDNDCSGGVDDDAIDATTWYGDADGDGFGAPDQTTLACEAGASQVAAGDDCDDGDAGVNPDADEVCDGIDNDCSGSADDGAVDASAWYADTDGDGFGDASDSTEACTGPSGFVADDTDCDDTVAAVFPGADEICDALDNDCDGDIDAGLRVPGDHATIQAALDAATAGDEVCVAAGTHNESLAVSVDVRIVGAAGSAAVVVDAQGAGPVLLADQGTSLQLQGLTLQGGDSAQGAGLRLIGGSATLEDVVITGNVATGATDAGAGIHADGATLTITNSEVSDNHVTEDTARGGGIFANESIVSLEGVALSDNAITGVDGNGGGLYATGGTLDIVDSDIAGNTLDGSADDTSRPGGAGVSVSDTPVVVRDTTVHDNAITHSAVSYVYASGAGLRLVSESIELDGVTLEGNSIDITSDSFNYVEGVGLYTEGWNDEGGTTSLTDVEIRDNDASSTSTERFAIIYGGGATLYGDNENLVDGLTITGNTGTTSDPDGSGFIAGLAIEAFEGTIAGTHLDIRDNTATSDGTAMGGMVSLEWTAVDLQNVVLAGNQVSASGDLEGGLLMLRWDDYDWYTRQDGADAILTNIDVVGNVVQGDTVYGGFVSADWAGLVALANANITGNSATGTTAVLGAAGHADTDGGGSLTLSYVNAHDNAGGAGDWEDNSGVLSLGALDLDPAHTDTSATDAVDWDLSLSSGSAAIDAGDPGILDADGSTSDLGAYGGPAGGGW